MSASFPSTGVAWEWSKANGFIAPVLVVAATWSLLALEHLLYVDDNVNRWQSRFQALYVRIVFTFPCFAALAYIGACFPWLSHWTELAAVGLEAYVLLGFYALLTGLGHILSPPGTFPECLVAEDAKWTNKPFRCCGRRFKSGRSAQRFFFWGIVQFSVIKPTILLVDAILYWQSGGQELAQGMRVVHNLIMAVSTIWATLMVLRLYKGLQMTSIMDGHRGLFKIGVVKLLFVFVVLNNLILRNLAAQNKLPVPPRVCATEIRDANEKNRTYCETRMVNLIFLLEVLICIVPAVLAYRHHGLGLDLTRKRLCRAATPRFLYFVFCCPFDLRLFWSNRLPVDSDNQVVVMDKDTDVTNLSAQPAEDLEQQQPLAS